MRTFIGIVVAFAVTPILAQSVPSPLVIAVERDAYFGEEYVESSDVGAVFFDGEPILFKISIQNRSDSDAAVRMNTLDWRRLLSVEAFYTPVAPPPGRRASAEALGRWMGGGYENELPARVETTLSDPVRVWRWTEQGFTPSERTVLGPWEAITWTATVPNAPKPPGLYRLAVRVSATDDSLRTVAGPVYLSFEVRSSSDETRLELLRRQAASLLHRQQFAEARYAVEALLKEHPRSLHARYLLARIAEASSDEIEAQAQLREAEQILMRGEDPAAFRHKSPREATEQLGAVQGKLRRQ